MSKGLYWILPKRIHPVVQPQVYTYTRAHTHMGCICEDACLRNHTVFVLDIAKTYTPPSSVVVNTQGRESGGSGFETCSARVRGTPGGALVVWPSTPWLIS